MNREIFTVFPFHGPYGHLAALKTKWIMQASGKSKSIHNLTEKFTTDRNLKPAIRIWLNKQLLELLSWDDLSWDT